MIPFNAPPVVGTELDYMQSAMGSGKLCGDGGFTRRCQQWLEQRFGSAKVLLTPSCTASLEMAALLLDIQPGDEVIMPSYTFVSTANAFVLRGAKIVFVDVRPDTMNIDET
ncbi:aminotransferase class I/II-fold pyridoxal phosphate-dependent enzyme, partial [Escherichia coli]